MLLFFVNKDGVMKQLSSPLYQGKSLLSVKSLEALQSLINNFLCDKSLSVVVQVLLEIIFSA